MSLVLAGVTLPSLGRCDVRVAGGTVAEIGSSLARRPDDQVVDGDGGRLLPGLHDHHLHLRALAAAAGSAAAGPPLVTDRDAMASSLRAEASEAPAGSWLRAVGYHESVAGDLDRRDLDEMVADRPVRVQHRTGALWVVNSVGAEQLELDEPAQRDLQGVERDAAGHATGRLFRLDRWLRDRVPRPVLDLGSVSRGAAARGVTGFTDATPGRPPSDVHELAELVRAGVVVQRLYLMCPPDVPVPDLARVERGPVKILLDDATIPTPTALAGEVASAHQAGLPVAVHCVTTLQLVVTVQAFHEAGPLRGDRVEHASVVPAPLVDELRRLGLTVVTNPSFVAERGDQYLEDLDPVDLVDLYRCRSLLEAGVPVAAGTDAPFASADPWRAVRAAVERTTPSGAVLGPDECVDLVTALGLFLGAPEAPGTPRSVRVGARADLCLLRPGGSPPEVAATLVDGRVVFDAADRD